MNELFKRTITGVIYVFLLLSAIMLNPDAFDFLFLSFGIICLFEFKMLIRLKELHIFLLFLLVWWLLDCFNAISLALSYEIFGSFFTFFATLVVVYSPKNLSFFNLHTTFSYFAYQYISHNDAFQ